MFISGLLCLSVFIHYTTSSAVSAVTAEKGSGLDCSRAFVEKDDMREAGLAVSRILKGSQHQYPVSQKSLHDAPNGESHGETLRHVEWPLREDGSANECISKGGICKPYNLVPTRMGDVVDLKVKKTMDANTNISGMRNSNERQVRTGYETGRKASLRRRDLLIKRSNHKLVRRFDYEAVYSCKRKIYSGSDIRDQVEAIRNHYETVGDPNGQLASTIGTHWPCSEQDPCWMWQLLPYEESNFMAINSNFQVVNVFSQSMTGNGIERKPCTKLIEVDGEWQLSSSSSTDNPPRSPPGRSPNRASSSNSLGFSLRRVWSFRNPR